MKLRGTYEESSNSWDFIFVIAGLATYSGHIRNLATTECDSPYVEICLNNTLQMGGVSGGSGQGKPAMLAMRLF